jgi:putative membrane protein
MKIVSGALAGAVAGLAGAYAMERFQTWWSESEKRLEPKERASAHQDEPTTVKAAERIAEDVLETELPEDAKPAAGRAVHYAMGAVSGAIYGATGEVIPFVRWGNGLIFGALLWWVADNEIVPAVGLAKGPESYPPSTHAYALASHLVYGFVTETVRTAVRLVL